jgi:hypothetical protein
MSETVRLATIVTLSAGGIFAGGLIAEPINSQFRRRPEGVVPPNADRMRQLWRRFHLVRAALGVVAYSLLVVAATYA